MTETMIDASNISMDILIWLKRANDGHYYIERKVNKYNTHKDKFRISIKDAEKLQTLTTRNAWHKMEQMVGAAYE
jgi:hypothetical protein